MAISTITVGGQTVTLVDLPASPGLRTVQFDFDDPAATVRSEFTGQMQVQRWPGADSISGTVSLPPLTQAQADEWIAFLMLCRGQANAFRLGDPLKRTPRTQVRRGLPVVNGTDATKNLPGSDQLATRGWVGAGRLLEAGDWLQVGNRLYRNLLPVMQTSRAATLTVWPTLREQPPDGTAIVLNNPRGLFRLGRGQRTWNADYKRLTTISFPITEWRGSVHA